MFPVTTKLGGNVFQYTIFFSFDLPKVEKRQICLPCCKTNQETQEHQKSFFKINPTETVCLMYSK